MKFAAITWIPWGVLALGAAAPALAFQEPLEPMPASASVPKEDLSWLVMPDDPVGRLWAGVGPETSPWTPTGPGTSAPPTQPGRLAVDPRAISGFGAASWKSWAEALEIAASGKEEDAERRRAALATLSAFAAADGRGDDAFEWLLMLGADEPRALCGTLPFLFPGVPHGTEILPGGRPARLPKGVLLRPQLPPPPRVKVGRGFARRATAKGLRIGDATIDLLLKLDGSGVVCDITHVSGGPAEFELQLPAPKGARLKSLYVDWAMQGLPAGDTEATVDWSLRRVKVTVLPPDDGSSDATYTESFSVFARLDAHEAGIPANPSGGTAAALPISVAKGGLKLVVPAAGPDDFADLEAMCAAFQRSLALPVELIEVGTPTRTGKRAFSPTEVRFHATAEPLILRRQMTSAIESHRRGG